MNIDYGISTIEINGTDVVMLTVGDGKTGFVDVDLTMTYGKDEYKTTALLVTYTKDEQHNIGSNVDISNKQFKPEDYVIMFNFTNSKSVQSMIDQLENIRDQLEAKE